MAAKEIYHTFVLLVYLFPIFGAMVSDSWLGSFKTIFYVSIIHLIGNSMIAVAALTFMPMRTLTLIGLFVIAVGTGGIKPCVAAFGGDQFNLPEDNNKFKTFFGWFYFSISCGSCLATIISPILRNHVSCFGQDTCFPLAFAVPSILMFLSLVIFLIGKPLYKIQKPYGNLVLKTIGCICYALRNRIKMRNEPRKPYFLDYASDRYSELFIESLRACGRILLIFIPIPMFWALYDQHGSGWTFMATRMDGSVGQITILPDQFQVANTVLILGLIPLFDYVIYPLLAKKNILTKLLHRMLVGGLFAVLAFIISGVIQIKIEEEYPVLPEKGEAQLRIYNGLPCSVRLEGSDVDGTVSSLSVHKTVLKIKGSKSVSYKASVEENCGGVTGSKDQNADISEKQIEGHHLTMGDDNELTIVPFTDSVQKQKEGLPVVRSLVSGGDDVKYEGETSKSVMTGKNRDLSVMKPHQYKITINGATAGKVLLKQGGVYALMISATNQDTPTLKLNEITPPNTVHMLWLFPQYLFITIAEILIAISSYEFAYSQAPGSMKSLMQAVALLTSTFGNLYILMVTQLENFVKEWVVYFIWAGLMFLDMLLFVLITWNYKYVEKQTTVDELLAAEQEKK